MADGPVWFRRWFGFGYWPVAWQGWVTIAAALATEAAIGSVALAVRQSEIAFWCVGTLFIGVYAATWVFIENRTYTDYRGS